MAHHLFLTKGQSCHDFYRTNLSLLSLVLAYLFFYFLLTHHYHMQQLPRRLVAPTLVGSLETPPITILRHTILTKDSTVFLW